MGMNEFAIKWGALSKSQRRAVRRDMQDKALALLTHRLGLLATIGQLRSGAKKKVDMAIAQARRA